MPKRRSEEPKPCPYCGKQPEVTQVSLYQVVCVESGCSHKPSTVGYAYRGNAVLYWNRMVDAKAKG
jgi:hypothetical protein